MADLVKARPLQAALSSALSFTVGATLPLSAAMAVAVQIVALTTTLVSLRVLATLGAVSARTGGAPVARAVMRVTFWGAVAMTATALVGIEQPVVWNFSGAMITHPGITI